MKTLCSGLILLVVMGHNIAFASNNICKDTGLRGELLNRCGLLCKSQQCDIFDTFPTSEFCVESFDKYFEKTEGEIPACYPSTSNTQVMDQPMGELWCYANWKMDVQEICDPLFNPDMDEYDVINENDGITQYELCLKNQQATFDICVFGGRLLCYSRECWGKLSKPCYDEYEITKNQSVLADCLEGIMAKVDECIESKCSSYFYENNFRFIVN